MQYHKRFQQRYDVKRIEFKGKLSITHIGGGKFVYTIPTKSKPHVGRIDFSELPYKKISLVAGFSVSGFLLFFMVFSKSGVATTNEKKPILTESREKQVSEVMELTKFNPEEIERKSEEYKNRLLKEDTEVEKALQDKKVKYISYTVREGDTLNAIAAKYRIPAKFIITENQLKDHTKLKVGQVLKIPNKAGIFYKIKKGDRLVQIAEKYQILVEDIIKDNELVSYAILPVGKKIFLPNAVIPEPPPIWVSPVKGKISSHFGYRIHPLFGYRHFHSGIDISLHYEPVRAARDGIVYFAGFLGGYGKTIILKHGSDYKTLYAHLSKIRVREGQMVKAGQVIGISGNTGLSTGPHLHFEVIYRDKAINPLKYVKF
ncbi:MAG: M23 family metallopeptidase [Leptospiraceae bacterium]|nr:M23 family metallopeptidase [Leptospiraceae bacterium]MDW7976772.1 M23 family metallopeptidase [Leptospiraceae bacterium]